MDRYRDLPQIVRALGDRLVTLHLSDYDGVDEKHELPGRGVVDWKEFMQALRDIDYSGPFNYESKADGNNPAERVASFEENFKWLRSL
jgi:sugar phosphate isomerase/epimerase